jgi:hypothetical protein
MKKEKIIFWTTTGIIFLFEGLMPALTSQSELAKEGIRHLGYPEYFGVALAISKVLGSLVITIPQFPKQIKEWAYVGLGIELIFAAISHAAVDGFNGHTIFPLVFLAILATSYRYFHKLNA